MRSPNQKDFLKFNQTLQIFSFIPFHSYLFDQQASVNNKWLPDSGFFFLSWATTTRPSVILPHLDPMINSAKTILYFDQVWYFHIWTQWSILPTPYSIFFNLSTTFLLWWCRLQKWPSGSIFIKSCWRKSSIFAFYQIKFKCGLFVNHGGWYWRSPANCHGWWCFQKTTKKKKKTTATRTQTLVLSSVSPSKRKITTRTWTLVLSSVYTGKRSTPFISRRFEANAAMGLFRTGGWWLETSWMSFSFIPCLKRD